jgi:hypothetical protein
MNFEKKPRKNLEKKPRKKPENAPYQSSTQSLGVLAGWQLMSLLRHICHHSYKPSTSKHQYAMLIATLIEIHEPNFNVLFPQD